MYSNIFGALRTNIFSLFRRRFCLTADLVSPLFEPVHADLDAAAGEALGVAVRHGHVAAVYHDGAEAGGGGRGVPGPGGGRVRGRGGGCEADQLPAALLQQHLLGVHHLGLLQPDQLVQKIVLKHNKISI